MDFKDLATKRFSARKYTTEAVSDKQLHYLLECARLAPSAVNKQPWKFIVERAKKQKPNFARHTIAIGLPPLHSISFV